MSRGCGLGHLFGQRAADEFSGHELEGRRQFGGDARDAQQRRHTARQRAHGLAGVVLDQPDFIDRAPRPRILQRTLYALRYLADETYRRQQTEQALCLSLAVNAIITWNTAYLELALNRLAQRCGRIDHDLLAHISPALMEHVNP